MATASVPSTASLRLKIDLQEHVLAELERQAEEKSVSIEEVISERLASCVSHTSVKPIYVDDTNRKKIEAILGWNLSSVVDLTRELRKATSLRVDNVHVILPQEVRVRLATRNLDKGVTYDEFVARITRKLIQEYVGR